MILSILKSLADEVAALHAKVDKIDIKIDNLATNGFVAALPISGTAAAVVELDDATIDLIDRHEKLEELEHKLKTDSEYRSFLFETMKQHCDSSLPGDSVAYTLVDKFFVRKFLLEYSWGGGSRKNHAPKRSFKQFIYFFKFFYRLVKSADASYTAIMMQYFFQNKLLPNSGRRVVEIKRAPRAKFRHSHMLNKKKKGTVAKYVEMVSTLATNEQGKESPENIANGVATVKNETVVADVTELAPYSHSLVLRSDMPLARPSAEMEVAALHAKVDEMGKKIDNLATNGYVAALSLTEKTFVELDDATFDMIDKHEKLQELERKLETDSTYRTSLFEIMKQHCDNSLPGDSVAYTLIDKFFVRKFLLEYSWSGGSRKNHTPKNSFKQYHYFIKFFFRLVKSADATYTAIKMQYFFQHKLLPHSSRRVVEIKRAPRAKFRRLPMPNKKKPFKKDSVEEMPENVSDFATVKNEDVFGVPRSDMPLSQPSADMSMSTHASELQYFLNLENFNETIKNEDEITIVDVTEILKLPDNISNDQLSISNGNTDIAEWTEPHSCDDDEPILQSAGDDLKEPCTLAQSANATQHKKCSKRKLMTADWRDQSDPGRANAAKR